MDWLEKDRLRRKAYMLWRGEVAYSLMSTYGETLPKRADRRPLVPLYMAGYSARRVARILANDLLNDSMAL